MARCFAAMGARPGDIVQNAYGYGLFTGGLGAHYGAERLGCTVIPMSGGGTERQVTLMQDFGATVLCATPTYALNIAEVAENMGVDIRKLPLHIGIFGAEPWTDAMRRDIEAKLGIQAIDIYGLSEIIGPGVACECRDEERIARLGGSFPVRDRRSRHHAADADGRVGRTGDHHADQGGACRWCATAPATSRACRTSPAPAGAAIVRMLRVTGRTDDMLIIRGVNVYPSQVEAVLVGFPGLAPHYQIILTREHALDDMRVEVEQAPDFKGDRAQKAKEVTHHIKSLIGVTCKVVVKAPGEVPRSQGKAVRVVDQRKKAN